uniref:Serine protease like protein n=1 Tax=Agriosphodrus dohrni TaxID=184613 RepID=I4DUB3_AGRDO|nr:serine protease like protein [Agriosphodrus dohrni]
MDFLKICFLIIFYIINSLLNHQLEALPFKSLLSTRYKRIVSGDLSEEGEFPWMTAIFIYDKYSCSGALITERHVLTAGHCFQALEFSIPASEVKIAVVLSAGHCFQALEFSIPASEVKIAVGIVSLSEVSKPRVLYPINRLFMYPTLQYEEVNDVITPLNDLAVAQLINKITFSPLALPLKLPHRDKDFTNYTATIAGWGATYELANHPSNDLLYTTVKILDMNTCLETPIRRHVSRAVKLDSILCAYGGRNDGCKGDSGAPLIVRTSPSVIELAGIMSWGVGCGCSQYPAVYTKTSYYIDWITSSTSMFLEDEQ